MSQIRLLKIIRRGETCRLKIEGVEKSLLVPVETVHKHRLVEQIVLTESQLRILKEEADRLGCDLSASRMLTRRAHSIGELKAKLGRKEYPDQIIQEAIRKYQRLGFLDDTIYARRLVESSLARNPSGRAYLMAMMQRKLISRSLAEQTVGRVLESQDETELAVKSLEKRWRLLKDLELERARTRAYNYLSRRGISYAAAKAAFEKLKNED